MPRPFPGINQPIYAPGKTELRNKVSLLTSFSILYLLQQNINLPVVFLSSTKHAMCTGRQELWYGSFFKILITKILRYILLQDTE